MDGLAYPLRETQSSNENPYLGKYGTFQYVFGSHLDLRGYNSARFRSLVRLPRLSFSPSFEILRYRVPACNLVSFLRSTDAPLVESNRNKKEMRFGCFGGKRAVAPLVPLIRLANVNEDKIPYSIDVE